ncbi:MAG TPA: hypothetical protein VI815_00615 [Candidatus Nanoarchaeia archaeon]|nr:hypothetical protein [Candidatus Nanoarchaeia archaeon]
MKRGRVWFLIILSLIIVITSSNITLVHAEWTNEITGDVISGKASSNDMNVSISIVVDGDSPNLQIVSPKNRTYNKYNLSLNYSVSDSSSSISSVWYSLDGGANITLTSNMSINTSSGSHNLIVYANDSVGNFNSSNVLFFVNSSHGSYVNWSKYNGSLSTNLTYYQTLGIQYMQNITNLTFENPNYGRIVFNSPINISRDIEILDDYTNIGSKSVYINSNYLSEFNSSATIFIYSLTFSNPRVSMDGEVCPSTICAIESYSGGILRFNVSHFTTYSVEETPGATQTVTTTGGSSGGGGGGSSVQNYNNNLVLSSNNLKVSLKQGETKREEITIKNQGATRVGIILFSKELDNFIKISERDLNLAPGEEKTVYFDFIAAENSIPNLYIGSIVIKGTGIERKIPLAIQVNSKKSLFDVKIEIPKKFISVEPGDEVLATIKIFNLGEISKVDAKINYFIKDSEGRIIVSDEETIAVETQASFVKELKLPEDINLGDYIFEIETTYNNEIAGASTWFSVRDNIPIFNTLSIYILLIIVLVMFIIVLVSYIIPIKRLRKGREKHKNKG